MANVATLSTSADLSASQTAGTPALIMPTGVVLPYAGNTSPSGWLACNGAAVSRTTYADLFAAISTTFGVGDGSTTFNLPDLRGRFPRFNDAMFGGSAAGRDSGRVHGSAQAQATAKNGLTNASSAINGTGANSPIINFQTNLVTSFNNGQTAANGAVTAGNTNGTLVTGSGQAQGQVVTGTATAQVITGDAETRPINLSINAIIKI